MSQDQFGWGAGPWGRNATTALYVTWQAPMIDTNAIFAPVQGAGTISNIVWLGYTYKGL